MKISVFPYLRRNTLLYSFLAVYMLGFAVYWDYSYAHQTAQAGKKISSCCAPKSKSKPKCCSDSECCATPKTENKSEKPACPATPYCPCEQNSSPAPLPYLLNENIVAYQNQQKKKQKFLHKFSEKELYNLHFQAVALPTLPLPTATGKERLRYLRVWRV